MSWNKFKRYIFGKLSVGLTNSQREETVDCVSKLADTEKKVNEELKNNMQMRKENFSKGTIFLQEIRTRGGVNFTCEYTCFNDPVVYYTYTIGLFNIRFCDLTHLLKCTDENLEGECCKVEDRIIDLYVEVLNFVNLGWQEYDSGVSHPEIYQEFYKPTKESLEPTLYFTADECEC